MTILTDRMLEQAEAFRQTESMYRLARWGVIVSRLAAPFGGVSRLWRNESQLALVAAPVGEQCRCDGQPANSRLLAVSARWLDVTGSVQMRRVDGKERGDLAPSWIQLSDAVCDLLPHHSHEAFILDFGLGALGCWHDWTCLDCNGEFPCHIIDLHAQAIPVYLRGPVASAGLPVIGSALAYDQVKITVPGQRSSPRERRRMEDLLEPQPVRPALDLVEALVARMHTLHQPVPCDMISGCQPPG